MTRMCVCGGGGGGGVKAGLSLSEIQGPGLRDGRLECGGWK